MFLNVVTGTAYPRGTDMVGFSATSEVVVSTSTIPAKPTFIPTATSIPTTANLAWLSDLIQRLENEPLANTSTLITQYEYKVPLMPTFCLQLCWTFPVICTMQTALSSAIPTAAASPARGTATSRRSPRRGGMKLLSGATGGPTTPNSYRCRLP